MASATELIRGQRLFAGIAEENAALLAASASRRRHARGELILQQGTAYERLVLLVEGAAAAEMASGEGKAIIIEEFTAPETLAAGIIFAEDNELPVSVMARTEAETLSLEKPILLECLRRDRAVLAAFLSDLSSKILTLSERLSFLAFRSIRSKLAHYLVSLPLQADGVVVLPRGMEELAAYFGVARPALSKVFMQMADEGLIEQRARRVRLLDIDALLAMAE